METSALPRHPADKRIRQILDPAHPICKDDVIWLLDAIKKKVADGDPAISDLPQPQLLMQFRYFAEAAMLLIHRRPNADQEIDRLRFVLSETIRGWRA